MTRPRRYKGRHSRLNLPPSRNKKDYNCIYYEKVTKRNAGKRRRKK